MTSAPPARASSDPRALPANTTVLRTKELERVGRPLRLAERVHPALAGRLAGWLFRHPRRHATPAREEAWLASAERLRLPYEPPQGAGRDAPRELAALAWGEGPTVLLQHGWEGRARQMGAFAAPLVERGLRAVALDAPAHGASGGRASSLIEFAAGLRSAGLVLGPVRGDVAHSLGAAATTMAAAQGLRTERLAFIAPPFDLDVYFELFLGALGLGEDVHARMIRGFERRFGHPWDDLRRVTVDGRGEAPLVVVHDEDDPETPLAGARAVADAWAHAHLHVTCGLGHRRVLRSRAVVETVATHFANVD